MWLVMPRSQLSSVCVDKAAAHGCLETDGAQDMFITVSLVLYLVRCCLFLAQLFVRAYEGSQLVVLHTPNMCDYVYMRYHLHPVLTASRASTWHPGRIRQTVQEQYR